MLLPRILLYSLVGAFIGGIRGWIWHRKKLDRQKRDAPPHRALPAPVTSTAAALSGPDWGWVWFHSAATKWRGLGYYYRGSANGPSLRVFADLRPAPDESTLRAEIAKNLPSGGTAVRLGPYRIVTTEGTSRQQSEALAAMFAAGRDPEGSGDAILLRVSPAERELFGLLLFLAFVDTIF